MKIIFITYDSIIIPFLIFLVPIKIQKMSYQSVLDYWFEPGKSNRWFFGGAAVDIEIKEKFGDMVKKLLFTKIYNCFLVK